MKLYRLFLGSTLAGAFAWSAGCGGKVVIDQGNGGAGQGGATSTAVTSPTGTFSSGSTGMTTVTATSSTGTPGGDIKSNCEAVCSATLDSGCSGQDCFPNCLSTFESSGECADEFAAVVSCYAQDLEVISQCATPEECVPAEEAYGSCGAQPDCGPQSCGEDSNGGCTCGIKCGGSEYSSQCQPSPSGPICLCSINGMPVTKCVGGSSTCDIFESCCGAALFGQSDDGGG